MYEERHEHVLPRAPLAPLFLRAALGAVFLVHGIQKFGNVPGFGSFLDSLHVPAPAFFAWAVTVAETGGGALLVLGLFTHWAARVLAADMLAATFLVHVPNGFFIQNGGYEFTLVLFAGLAALAVSGAGSWSLDYLLAHRRRGFRNIPEKLRPSPPPRGAQVLEEQEEP